MSDNTKAAIKQALTILLAVGSFLSYSVIEGALLILSKHPVTWIAMLAICYATDLFVFWAVAKLGAVYSERPVQPRLNEFKNLFKQPQFWLETIGWLLVVRAVQMILYLAINRHGTTYNQSLLNAQFATLNGKIYVISLGLFLAPFIEEMLFRVLPYTVKHLPGARIVSVIAFVLIHAPQNLFEVMIYGTMAIALAVCYERHGFWGSWTLHVMLNAVAIGAMFFNI